jgi:hypothetical protein
MEGHPVGQAAGGGSLRRGNEADTKEYVKGLEHVWNGYAGEREMVSDAGRNSMDYKFIEGLKEYLDSAARSAGGESAVAIPLKFDANGSVNRNGTLDLPCYAGIKFVVGSDGNKYLLSEENIPG